MTARKSLSTSQLLMNGRDPLEQTRDGRPKQTHRPRRSGTGSEIEETEKAALRYSRPPTSCERMQHFA